jgi:hypothetical protein
VRPAAEKREAQGPPEATRVSRLLDTAALVLAVAVAALVFEKALLFLGPDSAGLPGFNSDSAVPVLMSNETRWDIFHAYYFGEDRFGAWPFGAAHVLGGVLGQPVTPEFLHGFATLFLLFGAVPAMALCRPWPGLGLLAYVISLLTSEARGSLFELAQVYPWQLPLLFWAWWCLRRAARAEAGRPLALWLALASFVCFLATWTSALSGPLLLVLALVESRGQQAKRPRRWGLLLLPALVAILGEAALRLCYHLYVKAHFQRDFHTAMRLDPGHFLQSLGAVWQRLATPTVLGALGVLCLCVALLVRRRAFALRLGALECTVLGAFLLAFLPLPVLTLLRHVRLNDYAPRYFAPSYVLVVWGALVALAIWLPSFLKERAREAALLAMTVVLCALALFLSPREGADASYARMRRTAVKLAEAAPGAVLLDGYWGTYVFAALVPSGALLPLPRAGDWNRMPTLESSLPLASTVVVGHRGLLGEAGSEPRFLYQYGTLLELQEASFLFDGVDRFSAYRPRPIETLPHTSDVKLEGTVLEEKGLSVTLRTPSARRGTAVAVEFSCLSLASLPRAWAEGALGERLSVDVEAVPGAVLFRLPEAERPTALHLFLGPGAGTAACRIRGARWYVRPTPS